MEHESKQAPTRSFHALRRFYTYRRSFRISTKLLRIRLRTPRRSFYTYRRSFRISTKLRRIRLRTSRRSFYIYILSFCAFAGAPRRQRLRAPRRRSFRISEASASRRRSFYILVDEASISASTKLPPVDEAPASRRRSFYIRSFCAFAGVSRRRSLRAPRGRSFRIPEASASPKLLHPRSFRISKTKLLRIRMRIPPTKLHRMSSNNVDDTGSITSAGALL